MKHISYFGAVADGTGVGDGADNSVAFQDACDWLQTNKGGAIDFSSDGGWYRQDEPVTLFHPDNSQFAKYVLDGGGARIDCANMSGSDTAWTIGGVSTTQFLEIGGFALRDLTLKGPELAAGYAPGNTPATSTKGFRFQFAGNVHTDNLGAHFFKTGVEKKWSFSSSGSLDVGRNYIGLHHNDVSNDAVYSKVNAVNCRFGVVIASDGTYDSGKINNVVLNGLRVEDSQVGVLIDGGTVTGMPIIREIQINDIYSANNEYDIIRAGFAFDFANPGTPGSTRNSEIDGLYIRGGQWNPKNPGWGSSRRALRLGSNLKVSEVNLDIPIPYGTPACFDNRPRGGFYMLGGRSGGVYRGFKGVKFDSSGVDTVIW